MAWTATLTEIRKRDDETQAIIVYSDGTSKLVDTLSLDRMTSQTFRAKVKTRVDELEGAFTFIKTLSPGPIDTTPDTPVVPPAPTPTETARATFQAAYRTLQGPQRGVASGLVAAGDKSVSDALAAAKAAFDPSTMAGLL